MGICNYCGKPAGFLRGSHPDCVASHNREQTLLQGAGGQVIGYLRGEILGIEPMNSIACHASSMAQSVGISNSQLRPLLIKAFELTVEDALGDNMLSLQEEQRLMGYMQQFGLTQDELEARGAFSRLVKSAILRDLFEGKVPQRVSFASGLGVNLQKSEKPIWVFRNTTYYEDKIRRVTVGRTQGVNVRVIKGVYYRVGNFKGRPVEKQERNYVGDGHLVVTTKNIYFTGSTKAIRIPFNKIVAFEPYDNGFGLTIDSANALPQTFVTGDGWFSFNLVSNIHNL